MKLFIYNAQSVQLIVTIRDQKGDEFIVKSSPSLTTQRLRHLFHGRLMAKSQLRESTRTVLDYTSISIFRVY